MNTYLKEVELVNLRCFPREQVKLAVPDGKIGSGLTLLVGDNGTGKTTVLDAIDVGLGGKYRAESRLSISDATIFENDIEVICATDRFKVKAGSDFLKGKYFNSLGTRLVVKNRDRKAAGKFLSPPLSATSTHRVDEDFYYDEKDQPFKTSKSVDSRDKTFDPDSFGDNGLTVFYFDKNRGRHLSHGTYRTTLMRSVMT